MRSRWGDDACPVENRVEQADQPLMRVIGRQVVDATGIPLGVVVGRIISGTTIDLLVRRRRLFHRSRYLRLRGAAISTGASALVYQPPVAAVPVRLEVLHAASDDHVRGDVA